MIADLEQYIHAGIAEKGATAFLNAMSKVCMDISQTIDSSSHAGKIVRQGWLAVSARTAAAADLSQRAGMGSPFVMRRIK
jgi:hypothetical protein